jgi:hypothetical protein
MQEEAGSTFILAPQGLFLKNPVFKMI